MSEAVETLSSLYPGRWGALLIAVGSDKRPLAKRWNQNAIERFENGGAAENLERAAERIGAGENIGLVIPPGVVCLDADTPEAVSTLARFLPEDTPMQSTAHGAHFIVRVPGIADEEIDQRVAVEIAPGVEVDLRVGGKGQIVVEPSVHESGVGYAWKRSLPEDVDEIPEIPTRLRVKLPLRTKPKRPNGGASTEGPISKGKRDATLTSLAGTMRRRGMSAEAIEGALLVENAQRCDPPLPEAQVRKIARSVGRYKAEPEPGRAANGGASPGSDEARVLKAIAHLSPFEYEKQRKAIARKEGIRAEILDALRKSIEQGAGQGRAGEPVEFEEIDPWHEPVDGSAIAQEVEKILRERVILSEDAYVAVVLWVMHAHAHDAADHSPILLVTSPTRGCGKSLLLDVIEPMVPRPLLSVNSSAPALYRSAHLWPTVLVDEGDTFLAEDGQMVGFFNGGHRRGTGFIRCEGEDNQPRRFPAWCPKALAQIGMPRHATITDRSIVISMRKKAPGERIAFYSRQRHGVQLAETGRRLARWAQDHEEALRDAEPKCPSWLDPGSRVWDNWRPLCAIADSLGGKWGERAHNAARALQPALKDSNEELLADLRTVMESDLDGFWPTETLLRDLIDLDERDYARLGRGDKPITDRWLASRLRQFGIESERPRAGAGGAKVRGYYATSFVDAWARWLPTETTEPDDQEQGRKSTPPADSAGPSGPTAQGEGEPWTNGPDGPAISAGGGRK